ncbi:class I SAM-dependent methyltransferase [Dictyobacter kobayashii]|uniref:Methyltransferase n=1 Tax=Dictyobacter kobayashii TaxID=2014872 RepID=A0A402AYL0_9CHLR|nr:class I SAM-dependent methyltransferase [Dictyobacter kobayashii]GCE24199.1 methyltransferase [Dictyobacter kobayashii]
MSADNLDAAAKTNLHEETRRIWDQNASFWDEKMGEGNDFQRILVGPASERLLNIQPEESVLELACGNGVFSRRLAQLGAQVVATDFSAGLLEHAQARHSEHAERIQYQLVDATNEEQIVSLGRQRFDAAVCNMAIMDMSEVDPLMRAMRQVVKPGGRFVFCIMHPCFNQSGMTLYGEETNVDGKLVTTYGIKITSYLHNQPQKGIGIIGQPVPQYYFDRPLHVLFGACFKAGLVMDGIEEPAFNHPYDGSHRPRSFGWANYSEIPPVLAVRLRVP